MNKNKQTQITKKQSSLPHIEGLAVDNYNTQHSHQLAHVCYDSEYNLYRLDYSVHCVGNKESLGRFFPENFFKNIANRNKNRSTNHQAERQYDLFIENAVQAAESQSFSKDEYKPALTFSYLFDPSEFKIVHALMMPTMAKMKSRIDYGRANKMMKGPKRNLQLHLWSELVMRQGNDNDGSDFVDFKNIVEKTSDLAQKTGRDYSFHDQVDAILRVNKKHVVDSHAVKPVISFLSTKEVLEKNICSDACQLPITTNKKEVGFLNSAFVRYRYEFEKNMLEPEEVSGLAAMCHNRYVRHNVA